MRNARKDGAEIVLEKKKVLPVIRSGGFYNTVERCTLSHLNREIVDKACGAFNMLSEEEKHKLQFSPKHGELAGRACFWKELLGNAMPEKQCHIAMAAILHWYIYIKRMGFVKGA